MSASRVGRALRTREPPFRVMEQPGVRALSMEWADYTNNQEVVPALRALCTTCGTRRDVFVTHTHTHKSSSKNTISKQRSACHFLV